ncbi:MAG: hypothetical protein V9H26_16500 [Verrucomicrobiota bacterium]
MLGDLDCKALVAGYDFAGRHESTGPSRDNKAVGNWHSHSGRVPGTDRVIYQPGLHNGWLVEGTNSLALYFGHDGRYLKEWFPAFPVVKPVSAGESEAARNTLSNEGLYIGNLRFAATPDQFDELLGPPNEKRTEWQLEYFLGKRSRLSSDEMFLELHFDQNRKLTRIVTSEH